VGGKECSVRDVIFPLKDMCNVPPQLPELKPGHSRGPVSCLFISGVLFSYRYHLDHVVTMQARPSGRIIIRVDTDACQRGSLHAD
jgi:hypothetical protein